MLALEPATPVSSGPVIQRFRMLQGDELRSSLDGFLTQINHDQMQDFFLTFRPYLAPLTLFHALSTRFTDATYDNDLAAGHFSIVRIFAALRHWIDVYFRDDFLGNDTLSSAMDKFLAGLGGYGADEISTEARIAKKLRKTWSEALSWTAFQKRSLECSELLGVPFLRERHVILNLHPTLSSEPVVIDQTRESMGNPVPPESEADDTIEEHSDEYQSIVAPPETRYGKAGATEGLLDHHQELGDSPAAACFQTTESLHVTSRASANSELFSEKVEPELTQRINPPAKDSISAVAQAVPELNRLRRKPGGILKNVGHVTSLLSAGTRSRASSSSSYTERDLCFQRLRNSCEVGETATPETKLMSDREYVYELARMFEGDSSHKSDKPISEVISDTMAKLEGRAQCLKKRKSSEMQCLQLKSTTDEEEGHELLDEEVDGNDVSRTEKRRKRAACLDYPQASGPIGWSFASDEEVLGQLWANPSADIISQSSDLLTQVKEWRGPEPTLKVRRQSSGSWAEQKSDTRSSVSVSIIEALAIEPLPKLSVSTLEAPMTSAYRSWLLDHNTVLLAQCFTTIEKAVFLEIDWLELTSLMWLGKESPQPLEWGPLVRANTTGTRLILSRHHLAISWISSEILFTTDTRERSMVISKFIDIAQLCRNYDNFATSNQIVMALLHPEIARLSATWELVSDDCHAAFSKLLTLFDGRSDWRILKAVQERVLLNPEACVVPFVGPYLSALQAAERASSTVAERMTSTAEPVKVLMNMLGRVTIEEDRDHHLVDKLLWISGTSEVNLQRLSRARQA